MEVFWHMDEHLQNIEIYLQNGGNPKIADRYRIPTLENRAKIAYLLSNLPQRTKNITQEIKPKLEISEEKIIPEEKKETEKPKFLGLITQYPVQLHSAYSECFSLWISICSQKSKLNAVAPDDEELAYEFQTDMLRNIHRFDRLKSALEHYNQYKEVLATESARDFSKMTPLDLDKERRNLSSAICKRKQTISKKEKELPEKSSPLYHKRLEALNKKKRELEELILDEEKIIEILNSK